MNRATINVFVFIELTSILEGKNEGDGESLSHNES